MASVPYIKEITHKLIVHGALTTYSGKYPLEMGYMDFPQPIFYCKTIDAIQDLLSFGNIDINIPHPNTNETFLHSILKYGKIKYGSFRTCLDIINELKNYNEDIDLYFYL